MHRTASLCAAAVCAAGAVGFAPPAHAEGSRQHKDAAVASVERHAPELIGLSRDLWAWAETALHEARSSAALADFAQAQGFRTTRGVADLPTAFVAEYGEGRPIVGIVGEFDALPGLSQQAVPRRQAVEPDAPGHGCGHNLFGPGSLGAALAIKELIEAGALHGTVRFYGTPAEEAVGGKLYMLRAGLFQDLDVCLAWHPDSENKADTESSQALVDFVVEFYGTSAHAAFDPWNGRSAQDGLEVFTFALNLMREHVKPTVRMHYAMLEGAKVPNVVPDYAKLWCWVRDSDRAGVQDVLARLREAAQGAALATGVRSELHVQSGDYEMLVNMTGARALYSNLMRLGPPQFTAAEQAFARQLQRAAGVDTLGLSEQIEPLDLNPGEPQGGSTDVADVSWNVPTLHVSIATAPRGTPWHAWPVVACSGMEIGQRGMLFAAQVLATTMVDLCEDPKLLRAVRAEFDARTRGKIYQGMIPDGPPASSSAARPSGAPPGGR